MSMQLSTGNARSKCASQSWDLICVLLCALICVLSYVCASVLSYACSHMWSYVLWYLCALIWVLSSVCSHMCALFCVLSCVLSCVCAPMWSHICAQCALIILCPFHNSTHHTVWGLLPEYFFQKTSVSNRHLHIVPHTSISTTSRHLAQCRQHRPATLPPTTHMGCAASVPNGESKAAAYTTTMTTETFKDICLLALEQTWSCSIPDNVKITLPISSAKSWHHYALCLPWNWSWDSIEFWFPAVDSIECLIQAQTEANHAI